MTDRRFYIWIILIALALTFATLVLFYQHFKEVPVPPEGPAGSKTPVSSEAAPGASEIYSPSDPIFNPTDEKSFENIPMSKTFLVKEIDGRVLVYGNGGETFLYCAEEIDLFALPESDRKALREGVYCPSPEALASLLEDYSS